jgi:hypothetical protein
VLPNTLIALPLCADNGAPMQRKFSGKPVVESVLFSRRNLTFGKWSQCVLAAILRACDSIRQSNYRYAAMGCILASVRCSFCMHYNLRSNFCADVVCGLSVWPQVLAQMRFQHQCPTATLSIDEVVEDEEA